MLSLTATELPRFLACNGFVKLEAVAPIETDQTARKEGDAAHWLIEQVHNYKYGQPLESMMDKQAPNGVFITADMIDHVSPYLKDVQDIGQVESDTSWISTDGKWKIGARADHIRCDNDKLTVSDFKYGWRIVEPEMNFTLIWHAVGFLLLNKGKCESINAFEFVVYQPRPYHPAGSVRRWTIDREKLEYLWATMETALYNPSDTLKTGTHCYKCPAMVNCPAFRKAQMNALEVVETAFTDSLSHDELSTQLDITARAIEILEQIHAAYAELVKHRIKQGAVIPNYAVERSMGNREWKTGITAEFLKMLTGRDLTKPELVTPSQAEKLGVSKELVASFSTRNERGIKLVRMQADAQARKMFTQEKGN